MLRLSWLKWSAVLAVVVIAGASIFLLANKAAEVQVRPATYGAVESSIVANGAFVFSSEAKLSPEILGVVREVLVSEGQKVRQGDVVLRLDRRFAVPDAAEQLCKLAEVTDCPHVRALINEAALELRS